MAYTLMAESKRGVDWTEVQRAVMPLRKRVELFPVVGEAGQPSGLGMSIPQRELNDLSWEEITQLLDVLQKQFGMEVYDLATGVALSAETLEAVKVKFLGGCS